MSMQRLLESLPRHNLRELRSTRKLGEPVHEPRETGGSSCKGHRNSAQLEFLLCFQGKQEAAVQQMSFSTFERKKLFSLKVGTLNSRPCTKHISHLSRCFCSF